MSVALCCAALDCFGVSYSSCFDPTPGTGSSSVGWSLGSFPRQVLLRVARSSCCWPMGWAAVLWHRASGAPHGSRNGAVVVLLAVDVHLSDMNRPENGLPVHRGRTCKMVSYTWGLTNNATDVASSLWRLPRSQAAWHSPAWSSLGGLHTPEMSMSPFVLWVGCALQGFRCLMPICGPQQALLGSCL